MAITQFCFGALDGTSPTIDARNSIVETKAPTASSSATTAAADKDSTLCRVSTDTAVYVSFGSAPNATSDTIKFFVPAGAIEYFRVRYNDKAAVVTA